MVDPHWEQNLAPSLHHSANGMKPFIVVVVFVICPGPHFGEAVYSKPTFRTDALIDREADKFTILHGSLSFCQGEYWVMTKGDTHILQPSNFQIDELFQLIKTWSRIGAVEAGFPSNRSETTCRHDHNPQYCKWKAEQSDIPVVNRDGIMAGFLTGVKGYA